MPEGVGSTVAPDGVFEALWPPPALDLAARRAAGRATGAAYLLFVDPRARTPESFVLRAGLWPLDPALAADAEGRVAPFDAIAFSLDGLWAD